MFLTGITVVSCLLTSDSTARIPSILHNIATDWLKFLEIIQDDTLIVSVLSC
jgi:hypothetical protein